MRTLAFAALVSSVLTGCAVMKAPPLADPGSPEAGLLAEQQRAAKKKTTVAAAQPRSAATHVTFDVDRISQKLAGNADTATLIDCAGRNAAPYVEAHATWGDTLQDLQKRKMCSTRRPAPR